MTARAGIHFGILNVRARPLKFDGELDGVLRARCTRGESCGENGERERGVAAVVCDCCYGELRRLKSVVKFYWRAGNSMQN